MTIKIIYYMVLLLLLVSCKEEKEKEKAPSSNNWHYPGDRCNRTEIPMQNLRRLCAEHNCTYQASALGRRQYVLFDCDPFTLFSSRAEAKRFVKEWTAYYDTVDVLHRRELVVNGYPEFYDLQMEVHRQLATGNYSPADSVERLAAKIGADVKWVDYDGDARLYRWLVVYGPPKKIWRTKARYRAFAKYWNVYYKSQVGLFVDDKYSDSNYPDIRWGSTPLDNNGKDPLKDTGSFDYSNRIFN